MYFSHLNSLIILRFLSIASRCHFLVKMRILDVKHVVVVITKSNPPSCRNNDVCELFYHYMHVKLLLYTTAGKASLVCSRFFEFPHHLKIFTTSSTTSTSTSTLSSIVSYRSSSPTSDSSHISESVPTNAILATITRIQTEQDATAKARNQG